jgi:hypothetical protein
MFLLFTAMTIAIVVLEVELDRNFRVVEVDNEALGDE